MKRVPTVAEMRAYYAARAYKIAPKLTFRERCGAFAYLCMGARPSLVKEMFGLSRSSVSYLAGRVPSKAGVTITVDNPNYDSSAPASKPCFTETIGARDPGRPRDPNRKLRYQDVVDECERLGEDEFCRVYGVTDEMEEREKAAIRRLNADKNSKRTYFP